ncbi:MAG: hypothetical protein AAF288_00240 [Planctomycetota bacterium]
MTPTPNPNAVDCLILATAPPDARGGEASRRSWALFQAVARTRKTAVLVASDARMSLAHWRELGARCAWVGLAQRSSLNPRSRRLERAVEDALSKLSPQVVLAGDAELAVCARALAGGHRVVVDLDVPAACGGSRTERSRALRWRGPSAGQRLDQERRAAAEADAVLVRHPAFAGRVPAPRVIAAPTEDPGRVVDVLDHPLATHRPVIVRADVPRAGVATGAVRRAA